MSPAWWRPVVRCLGAAALVGALVACAGSSVKPPPQSLGEAVAITVPAAIQHIPLTKPDGTTTTLAAYQGKTVMIADFLTLCTDICPLISANTAALTRALDADGEGKNVAVLEITVDPRRDTAARLSAYQKLYGQQPPNWTLLRASPADTKRLWAFFGVDFRRVKEPKHPRIDWLTHRPLTYDVVHSDDLIFLAPDGRERFVVNADPDLQGRIPPKRLVKFLDPSGLTSIYHPHPVAAWTVGQALGVFSWLENKPLPEPS